jgi:hypothetical protein
MKTSLPLVPYANNTYYVGAPNYRFYGSYINNMYGAQTVYTSNASSSATTYNGTIKATTLTANRTYTLPNYSGTIGFENLFYIQYCTAGNYAHESTVVSVTVPLGHNYLIIMNVQSTDTSAPLWFNSITDTTDPLYSVVNVGAPVLKINTASGSLTATTTYSLVNLSGSTHYYRPGTFIAAIRLNSY